MKEAVAEPLGARAGELAAQQQRLGPGEQVVGDQDQLQPHGIHRKGAEGQLGKAGVLVVGDLVLGPGAGAVAALQGGDVILALVGEDRLEAVAV